LTHRSEKSASKQDGFLIL